MPKTRTAAGATLQQKCAKFVETRLGNQPIAVIKKVGPAVADAYYAGACQSAETLIGTAKKAASGRRCTDCAVTAVITEASDIVKQCHGAAQSQQSS